MGIRITKYNLTCIFRKRRLRIKKIQKGLLGPPYLFLRSGGRRRFCRYDGRWSWRLWPWPCCWVGLKTMAAAWWRIHPISVLHVDSQLGRFRITKTWPFTYILGSIISECSSLKTNFNSNGNTSPILIPEGKAVSSILF